MADKPVRHHVRGEWWFTRMPNGDVVVSAGSGSTVGITIAPNEWESVVREMGTDIAAIVYAGNRLLEALPDSKHEDEDGYDCWEHAWDELDGDAQDFVKEVRAAWRAAVASHDPKSGESDG